MRFLILLFIFAVVGCSSSPKGAEIGPRLDDKKYAAVIEKNTRHDVRYEGFYNKYEMYVTFLNSDTQAAWLQRLSDVRQWDIAQAQKERDKMFQENSTQTKFILSLFVPSPRLNDLHKGSSIWEIYFESNGKRYKGRATRRNGKLEDIQSLLPYHNRWSVIYDVVFDIPLSGAESGPAKFILTSSQGTSTLEF